MAIAETDFLSLVVVRKDDTEIDEDYDGPSDEEQQRIKDAFKEFIADVGSAIIAAQLLGLHDSAIAGAMAAGGGLTAREISQAAESAAEFNAEHFLGLRDDALDALERMLNADDLTSDVDLSERIASLMDAVASRAERYAKGGGNKAWSTALRQAGQANGVEGGIWDCNFGPGSCPDCEGLHGEWMPWDEFESTYQQTTCNGGCNCGFHAAANPESLIAEDIAPEEGDPLPPKEEAA